MEGRLKLSAAQKASIGMLAGGRYIMQEGWNPSYLLTQDNLKIERLNVMGVVTVPPSGTKNVSFSLEDGSGRITVHSSECASEICAGDCVMILGRSWIMNEEICIVADIIKKVDSKWLEVRKEEIGKNNPVQADAEHDDPAPEKHSGDIVIDTIKALDSGEGAEIEDILNALREKSISNGEEFLNMLLRDGEIFESRKGKVKLIE